MKKFKDLNVDTFFSLPVVVRIYLDGIMDKYGYSEKQAKMLLSEALLRNIVKFEIENMIEYIVEN